jgi:hypothetical protein
LCWGERLGWLVEVKFEFGFAGAECFRLILQRGQARSDLGCIVVEGASFEGDQVAVDGGGGLLELVLDRGELFAFRG